MRLYIISFFIFLVSACVNPENNPENPSTSGITHSILEEKPSYYSIRTIENADDYRDAYKKMTAGIISEKMNLLSDWEAGRKNTEEVGNYFLAIMRDSIFPYWYGTTWEFNGHTEWPREDAVACGYFISTPLRQIGLNVNRFKLAQQGAAQIMQSVCGEKPVLATTSKEKLFEYLNRQPEDGLYIIGLSFHVGFILRENGRNFIVHSDYFPPVAVCKKPLETSNAILTSNDYFLGSLSDNPTFLKKWLKGERIQIQS